MIFLKHTIGPVQFNQKGEYTLTIEPRQDGTELMRLLNVYLIPEWNKLKIIPIRKVSKEY